VSVMRDWMESDLARLARSMATRSAFGLERLVICESRVSRKGVSVAREVRIGGSEERFIRILRAFLARGLYIAVSQWLDG